MSPTAIGFLPDRELVEWAAECGPTTVCPRPGGEWELICKRLERLGVCIIPRTLMIVDFPKIANEKAQAWLDKRPLDGAAG